MQYKYKGNNDTRSRKHFCHGKAISNTYYERVSVALHIPHTKCIGRTILSSVVWLSVPYLSTLPRTRYHFRKKLL